MRTRIFDRRSLLQCALLGSAGYAALKMSIADAEALLKIAPNDATARGLDYHADAKGVDVSDYPDYEPAQSCATCAHLIDSGDQHGCKLMPGKEVNLNGWCKVWTAKS